MSVLTVIPRNLNKLHSIIEAIEYYSEHSNLYQSDLNTTLVELAIYVHSMPLESCRTWLMINDPNGIYTDEDLINDDCSPLTADIARELVLNQIAYAIGVDIPCI